MTELIIGIIIYTVSVLIWAVYFKKYECKYCETIEELVSEMHLICFIPLFNTLLIIAAIVIFLILAIFYITGVVWLWNKIKKIRI